MKDKNSLVWLVSYFNFFFIWNYNRINNLKGSDIVVILIGTNDNVNGFTNNQFTSAYNTMLDRINEVCPGAFVFCGGVS